jgi:hypothetical protein
VECLKSPPSRPSLVKSGKDEEVPSGAAADQERVGTSRRGGAGGQPPPRRTGRGSNALHLGAYSRGCRISRFRCAVPPPPGTVTVASGRNPKFKFEFKSKNEKINKNHKKNSS